MMRRAWLLEPWRTRVLWLSLALNVFCLALLAGPFWMGQPPGPPGIEAAVERMARSLGPDDAARFRTVIANERPWFAQARRQLDESRVALSRAMGRTPFDEAEVRLRMLQFQASWMESNQRFGDGMIEALSSISPEGRARLADSTLRRR